MVFLLFMVTSNNKVTFMTARFLLCMCSRLKPYKSYIFWQGRVQKPVNVLYIKVATRVSEIELLTLWFDTDGVKGIKKEVSFMDFFQTPWDFFRFKLIHFWNIFSWRFFDEMNFESLYECKFSASCDLNHFQCMYKVLRIKHLLWCL